jgi:transposase
LLNDPSKIKASQKKGGRKFIKETSKETQWVLDADAIARDERFDGFYAIQTNAKDLKPLEIVEAYHSLWKIEESFRIMKSTLEVRPVFHWTEKRIKGHFVVCFLAFMLERTLEFKLRQIAVQDVSPEKIREALNSLTLARINVNGEPFYIRAKSSPMAKQILQGLNIRQPKTAFPASELAL